jgi:hypothetical protein
MEPNRKLEMRPVGNPEPYLPYKRQTSDEELEEVRRRGCYHVLPPVLGPHEKVLTVDELLKDIDEEVRGWAQKLRRSFSIPTLD